jgi:hypothetical protein
MRPEATSASALELLVDLGRHEKGFPRALELLHLRLPVLDFCLACAQRHALYEALNYSCMAP